MKEESPSKAGLNKRRKLKNKHRRSLRMFNTHIHSKIIIITARTLFLFFN